MRRLLFWAMPACAAAGAGGLPLPDPLDITAAAAGRPGNAKLLAPGFLDLAPDIVAPVYPLDAATLFDALLAVGQGMERWFLAASYPSRLQAHFVARSARLNFPDLVMVEARACDDVGAAPVVFSRSVHGRLDFGVNLRRLRAFSDALDRKVATMMAKD
jgi:hypothetical protein